MHAMFQLDQSMHLRLCRICEMNKEELVIYMLGLPRVIFFKFGMTTPLPGGHVCGKFGSIWIRAIYIGVKITFSFSLSIYSHQLLGLLPSVQLIIKIVYYMTRIVSMITASAPP